MCSEYVKTLLGLVWRLIATNTVVAQQRFYPKQTQRPMIVDSEEFEENYLSLAGLEGVHVVTRFVSVSTNKNNILDMKSDLVNQIDKRLKLVGLRMLNKKELQTTPGQPALTFYPDYTMSEPDSKSRTTADTVISDEKIKAQKTNICRSSIWTSFLQSATIMRDPNNQFQLITWGSGDNTSDCENRGSWTYNAILKVVDKFTADYEKAEREKEIRADVKTVNNANEVPEDCSQAWTLNVSAFEANQTRISNTVKPILDELAKMAIRCKRYRYIIESHANQRNDADYNRLLSIAKAHSIKNYLLHKNISHDRLHTVAFGQSKRKKMTHLKKTMIVAIV